MLRRVDAALAVGERGDGGAHGEHRGEARHDGREPAPAAARLVAERERLARLVLRPIAARRGSGRRDDLRGRRLAARRAHGLGRGGLRRARRPDDLGHRRLGGRDVRDGRPAVDPAPRHRRGRAAGHDALGLRDGPAVGGGVRGAAEIARRRIAVLRVLGQRAGDHAVEADRRPVLRGPRRLLLHVRDHRLRHGAARVRDAARERVVEHAAERVDVGPRVDLAALELLRRHEVRGADPLPRRRQPRVRADHLGEAEVGEIGVLAAEQHVRGLDVAVHEADRVRGVQRRADLAGDRGHALGRQRALTREQVLQVRALHVAHDQVEVPGLLARRVDGDHVRVVDRRGDARLALEALAEAGVAGAVRGDELERDRPAERELGRAVDDAHAAAAGDRLDATAGEDGAWEQIGHGH